MAIYHVTREWDGADLRSLACQVDDGDVGLDEALESLAEKWGLSGTREAERYLDGDGREVHCHATMAEAIDYRDEHCSGGAILEIDDEELRVATGREYPHPVIRDRIPAGRVRIAD